MSWVARPIERDETAVLMKLANGHILGAARLATEGSELIQMHGTGGSGRATTFLRSRWRMSPPSRST